MFGMIQYMLPKRLRIHTYSLPLPHNKSYTVHTEYLTCTVLRTGIPKPSKFAVVVSKKGITAPTRNRIRRRIYEALGVYMKYVKPGYLCVISLKKGVPRDLPYDTLHEHVEIVLKKSAIMEI